MYVVVDVSEYVPSVVEIVNGVSFMLSGVVIMNQNSAVPVVATSEHAVPELKVILFGDEIA